MEAQESEAVRIDRAARVVSSLPEGGLFAGK